MAQIVTPEEMIRQARRLTVDAALKMTRLKPAMRRAVRLVECEGVEPHEAAKAVGRSRQNVYRALLVVRPKLALVMAEVERLRSRHNNDEERVNAG
jgi:DNA-directed RNA polymerase specialized sigma24 family protein